ncbi:hypothetical protein [Desulfolucanica intricata]|uniref:hypothetical protein n=1 Tax=Desulfolucanica intricata TaxID=1285191 RepID=UPI0008370B6E|nr:hypothetical protein [Desulfolucanica intricata]
MQGLPGQVVNILNYKLFWVLCGAFLTGSIYVIILLIKKIQFSKKHAFARELNRLTDKSKGAAGSELEVYINNLEARLETIITLNKEIRDKIFRMEGQMRVLMSRGEPENTSGSLEERIYRAFDYGKPITEIARETGKDKGEIELILNLRKLKNTSGGEVM